MLCLSTSGRLQCSPKQEPHATLNGNARTLHPKLQNTQQTWGAAYSDDQNRLNPSGTKSEMSMCKLSEHEREAVMVEEVSHGTI